MRDFSPRRSRWGSAGCGGRRGGGCRRGRCHRGRIREWTLNPLWVRLDRVVHAEFGIERLFLVSHGRRLPVIEGMVPSLFELPAGCRFQDRCPYRQEKCAEMPPLAPVGNGRPVRCFFPRNIEP